MSDSPPVSTNGAYDNMAGTTIGGSLFGVELGGSGTVTNEGTIIATGGTGVIVNGVALVINAAGAAIDGSDTGIFTDGAGTIANSGSVSGLADGITINGVGIVNNAATGGIVGATVGLNILGAATVDNFGDITSAVGAAVFANGVGLITNEVGGIVAGSTFGLDVLAAGVVANAGTITGAQGTGLFVDGVGTLTNATDAVISGSDFGAEINAGGAVTNAGTIAAALGAAVEITQVGTVTNDASGLIAGDTFGITIGAAGVVTNAGSISATAGTGVLVSGPGGVVNQAGGIISGSVFGVDMLGVAAVENAGTIDGGTGPLAGAVEFLQASGVLIVDAGAVFNGSVTDVGLGGLIELAVGLSGNTGTLDMGSSFSGFSTIGFDAGASWLLEGEASSLAAGQAVNGFAQADTIILEGLAETSYQYVAGSGLELSDGTTIDTIDLTGAFNTGSFVVTVLAGGETEIMLGAPCFAAGTMIGTAAAAVAVEDLRAGDAILLADGTTAPVRWIGHRRVVDTAVVRISAGALGRACPGRDLVVSSDHALWFGGDLVPAGLLVDGTAIVFETRSVTLFNIELERHGVLLAEGVAAESYLDTGNRRQFSNCPLGYDPVLATEDPCGEMVFAGARLEAIRAGLGLVTV